MFHCVIGGPAMLPMNDPQNDAPLCQQCGRLLPGGFGGVSCPSCLLLGVGTETVLGECGEETLEFSGEGERGRTQGKALPKLIGPYELLEPLGEGGFGVVFRARQQEPIRREVALKVIKPGMGSRDVLARFEAERQALALMDHPNIASVLDAGTTENGQPYFVMELVRGVPITDYCDNHRLGIRERLELFIPVCQAVQHAHQKSILHRDLKPPNILVTEVDGKPIPKVIDFGIAKALRSESDEINAVLTLTQEGMVIGTPQYMSPEQAGSVADVDTRSDIYTLGIILHELLTGQPPLSRELLRKAAFHEVLRLIREAETKRPSSGVATVTEAVDRVAAARNIDAKRLCTELQGDLDWIVLKALEKDRERRYATANALAHDLQRSLQDQPVSAGPPTFGYRVRKFVRRQRKALAISAAISVCLISGLVFGVVSLFGERAALAVAAERGREAELALEENRRTLSTSLFLQGYERWKNQQFPLAVAHLTQALRADASNTAARRLLLCLLLQRSWSEPLKDVPLGDEFIVREMPPLSKQHAGLKFASPDGVKKAMLTPDGSRVITIGSSGIAQIFEASSARLLHSHALEDFNSTTFYANGAKLLTTSDDGHAKVWDLGTGLEQKILVSHSRSLSFGALSKDEKHCLVLGADGAVFLCGLNEADGQGRRIASMERDLETGDALPYKIATFHPDGSRFLVGHSDVLCGLTATGEHLFTLKNERGSGLTSAIYDPTGRRIVTRLHGDNAELWDARDGKLIRVLANGNCGATGSDGVAFSPDGTRLAALAYKATSIDIWDTENGHLICETPDGGEESGGIRLFGLEFSPSGAHVAACAVEYRVHSHRSESFFARIWDANTAQVSAEPLGDEFGMRSVRFSKDGKFLATHTDGGRVEIWDVATGRQVSEPLAHPEEVLSVEFSEDGETILTQSDDTAYLWKLPATSTPVPEWFLQFAERLCGYRLTETMTSVRTGEEIATGPELKQLIQGSADSYQAYAERLCIARAEIDPPPPEPVPPNTPLEIGFGDYKGIPEKAEMMSFRIHTSDAPDSLSFTKMGETIAGTHLKLIKFEQKLIPDPDGGRVPIDDLSELSLFNVETEETTVIVRSRNYTLPASVRDP